MIGYHNYLHLLNAPIEFKIIYCISIGIVIAWGIWFIRKGYK